MTGVKKKSLNITKFLHLAKVEILVYWYNQFATKWDIFLIQGWK